MTPQNKDAGQTRLSRATRYSKAPESQAKKSPASRVHSRIFLDYISYEIPVHPVAEFLEPGEPVARLVKRSGAFRVELKRGESAHPGSTDIRPLVFVDSGAVQLFLVRADLRSPLKQVDAGCVFGDSPLLRIHTFGAEAVALQDTTVFLIDSTTVEEIVCGSPVLARRWLEPASRLVSTAERENRMILFGLLKSRVAALLIDLAGGGSRVVKVSQRR